MPTLTLACPSCAAPVIFVSAASVFAVCDYCQSTVVRHDLNLELLGKAAVVTDNLSPLQRGTMGSYHGVHFTLVGRVIRSWERGKWSEWYAWFDDGDHGWVTDAQGFYGILRLHKGAEMIPERASLSPGSVVVIAGISYIVDDIKECLVEASEGELPFRAVKGFAASCVDLANSEGRCATIEYNSEGTSVYVGEYLQFAALKFSHLRSIPGW